MVQDDEISLGEAEKARLLTRFRERREGPHGGRERD
jgi:hypothetical protein